MAEQQVVSQEFTFDHRVKRASWLARGLTLAMLLAALYLIPQIAGIVILIPVAASFFLKKEGKSGRDRSLIGNTPSTMKLSAKT